MIHVRYEGRSYDFEARELEVETGSPDNLIRQRVADKLGVAEKRLEFYTIDRPENGNIIVRPEAVYG
jgi:hypothetical protein